ncbi:MAG: hypothetical protein ABSC41_13420 [Acidimicrobiales bacterium]
MIDKVVRTELEAPLIRAEHSIEVFADLFPRGDNGYEFPPDRSSDDVMGRQVVRIRSGNDRSAEFSLDGGDMKAPRQVSGKNLTRGRIHAVGVEVDKFEVMFAGQPANGVDVAHIWTIGRLTPEIEPESR